jgi:hypothetical protein
MAGYASAVLADAPVHYWRMADAGGGLAHDIGSSPIALHGLGSAIATPLGYSGPNADGGSMDLALVGQYANTGNNITVATNPFSIELLYWNWQGIGNVGHIWQVQDVTQIAAFKNGAAWAFTYNGVTVTNATHYAGQRWVHLVCTYDGAAMRLFADANIAGPTAVAAQAPLAHLFELGTNLALSSWGTGYVAEVAIYNTALSSGRVNVHFAAIDSQTMVPVANSTGGSPGGSSLQLNQILAAVLHTYSNS